MSSGHSPISPGDKRLVEEFCVKEAFMTSSHVGAAAEVVFRPVGSISLRKNCTSYQRNISTTEFLLFLPSFINTQKEHGCE